MGNDLHLLHRPRQPATGHLRPPLGSVPLFRGGGLTAAVPEQLTHRAAILPRQPPGLCNSIDILEVLFL